MEKHAEKQQHNKADAAQIKRHSREGPLGKGHRRAKRPKRKKIPLSPAALRGQQMRMERRKARLKKLLRRFVIVLAILAVLALIFVFGFRLKTVNVTGNSRYTKEEILDLIQYDEQYHNTIIFYLQHKDMDVEGIPFLDGIYMDIGGADTINIEVVEKIVTGCIKDGERYIYIDTDGIVCEISDVCQEDVPLIEGLEYEEPQLNQMLNVTDTTIYNPLLNLTLLLKKYEMSVDTVRFSGDLTMSLTMGDIQVMLGGSDYLEDKVTELHNLLPELEGLKGTLHLENYDPSKDSIIFTKE